MKKNKSDSEATTILILLKKYARIKKSNTKAATKIIIAFLYLEKENMKSNCNYTFTYLDASVPQMGQLASGFPNSI